MWIITEKIIIQSDNPGGCSKFVWHQNRKKNTIISIVIWKDCGIMNCVLFLGRTVVWLKIGGFFLLFHFLSISIIVIWEKIWLTRTMKNQSVENGEDLRQISRFFMLFFFCCNSNSTPKRGGFIVSRWYSDEEFLKMILIVNMGGSLIMEWAMWTVYFCIVLYFFLTLLKNDLPLKNVHCGFKNWNWSRGVALCSSF